MKKKLLTCLVYSGFAASAFAEIKESDFYKETIHSVDRTVNLVEDYGANAEDDADDSKALQKAIDDMTALPHGGKIIIPKGTFYLEGVLLKSNVHLEIDSGATLVPTRVGILFLLGLNEAVRNVSIRGTDGRYTVDLTSIPAGRTLRMAFANCKNVDNFMIADFNILDNFTALSSLTFNLAEQNGKYFRARNCVIKNGYVDKGHFGYGLVQAQAGYNILFKDLSATGGVTLRLETGAVTGAPEGMNLDQIYGRNISITNGHGGTMMGSHVRQNGHVDIDGVTSISSIFAASVGMGFVNAEQAAAGYKPGRFASSCIVKNVHAVYGEKAQLKPKNFKEVPEPLRNRISKTLNPDGVSYDGPSVGAARVLDPEMEIGNVTMVGFEYQTHPILTEDKKRAGSGQRKTH